MEWLSTCRLAAMVLALVWPMTQAETERALSIGRAFDEERARFHQPYVVAVNDPVVEKIEVVTEFRRVVLFAEEQIRRGDHLFGVRQAEAAMRPWHGKVTVVARLRFHPMNTFMSVPPYDITIGDPPVASLEVRRAAEYGFASNKKQAPAPLTGAIVESDFDAADIGQAVRPFRVVLQGKEVIRTSVDFSTLQ
jgi:hypothetical protein